MEEQRSDESQVDYISRILRYDIISLNLNPGETLSQNMVRTKFNSSRTPVREAFIRLEKEHLVNVLPQKSTKVTRINSAEIKDFLFMRSGIEGKVMSLLNESFPLQYITKLEKNIQQQELTSNQEAHKFIVLDNEFHALIYEGLGKHHIWNFLCSLQTGYDRLRNLFFQKEASYSITVEHHKLLLGFIKNHETQKAVDFVDNHIGNTFTIFENVIKEHAHFIE